MFGVPWDVIGVILFLGLVVFIAVIVLGGNSGVDDWDRRH